MGVYNANTGGGGADPDTIAGKVIEALNTGAGLLSRIKASAADALTDAGLATAGAVADVVADVVTAFNTGTSTLSRITASVAQAIVDKVADKTLPSGWGALQRATVKNVGGTSTEIIGAPPPGQQHEIMAYHLIGYMSTDVYYLENSDGSTNHRSAVLESSNDERALVPELPLFICTDALHARTAEGLGTFDIRVIYRTVPV